MRIAHIADIHIRSKERHDEIKEATLKLVQEIKKQKVDWLFVGGDIYHTKTNNITPEVVDFLSWWLKTISEHTKVHMILGNHDGNLTNLERQDTITPIVNSINSPNIFLYKKSGVYKIDDQTNLCVFSLFDKEGWSSVVGESGKINIGAFHGSVANCTLDNGWVLPEDKAEIKQSFFDERKLDFCLLGDIHLRQNIAYRFATGGQVKPFVAYPGSFRQNSFGESVDKGFLVWDIESVKKWNVTYTSIPNSFPFINVPWNTDIKTTIDSITETDLSKLERVRLKIRSNTLISQTEKEQNQIFLSEKFKTFELIYDESYSKKNIDVSLGSGEKFTTNQVKFDTDTILKFYCEVNKKLNKQKEVVEEVSEEEQIFVKAKIEQYKTKIMDLLKEQVQETERWSIKKLEFDNLFKYGSDNIIDFEKLFGIVGLFGPNAIGKSSVIGAIAYTLFNDSDRGSVKNSSVVNNNKERCKSKIVLEKGSKEYTVERETVKLIPKKQKNTPNAASTDKSLTRVNFSVRDLQTNIVTNLNGEEREETDKEIRKVFGTFEDFCLTSLSKQKGSSKFVDSGSTERKQILNKFLSLDVFEKYHKQAHEELVLIEQKLKLYNNIEFETEKQKLQTRMDQTVFELESLHQEKQVHENRLIELQAEFMNLMNNASYEQEQALQASINKMKATSSQLEERLNSSTKKLQFIQDSLKEKEHKMQLFEQIKQKISLDDLKQQLELHRTFDKELSELSSEHKYQNNKLEQQEKTVKKLSVVPCGDTFPTCMFIQDSHRDKHLIDDQKERVKKIFEKVEVLKRELVKIDPIRLQTQIANYESSLKKEILLQAEMSSSKKEIQSLEELLPVIQDSYNQEQSSLSSALEKYNVLFGEGNNKIIDSKTFYETEIKKQKSIVLDKEKSISLLNREGSEIEIKLEQNEQNKVKFEELKKLFTLQEKLTKSFSKTGIPSVVLKTQLPIINLEISKIVDPRFGFEVVLENNVTNNDMDIYLVDKTSARIIETCSGMEQTVASLAIRVALTNISNLPKSDLFICDESLDGVDDKNRKLCLNLFTKLKDYFKIILLVSHVEEIKEIADKVIEIQEIQSTGEAYVCVN